MICTGYRAREYCYITAEITEASQTQNPYKITPYTKNLINHTGEKIILGLRTIYRLVICCKVLLALLVDSTILLIQLYIHTSYVQLALRSRCPQKGSHSCKLMFMDITYNRTVCRKVHMSALSSMLNTCARALTRNNTREKEHMIICMYGICICVRLRQDCQFVQIVEAQECSTLRTFLPRIDYISNTDCKYRESEYED